MSEVWKAIAGYEGRYEVSDHGNVRSFCRRKVGAGPKVLKPGTDTGGYSVVVLLSAEGKRLTITVHRLVMLAFKGLPPDGCEVNHKDTIKSNNKLTNLEYTTRPENIAHAIANGRQAQAQHGEKAYNAELTDSVARTIKELIRDRELLRGLGKPIPKEMSDPGIAEILGVHKDVVRNIARGRTYKHV